MSVKRKIKRLEKVTNIGDIEYDIQVRRGLIISPTQTLWTDNEKRKYRADEQDGLKQQPGNRTSHDGEGREDLENDSGL